MINPYSWLAAAPHITVEYARLEDDEMGQWHPETGTIVLDERLTQAERRCTLMHELIHRLHKDLSGLPPVLEERQEKRCRDRSARLLIPLPALVDALSWSHGEHEHEIAEQLWVDLPTLRDRLSGLSDSERTYLTSRLRRLHERSA